MSPWIESLDFLAPNLRSSMFWLRVTNALCLAGCVASFPLAIAARAASWREAHGLGLQRWRPLVRWAPGAALALLVAATVAITVSVGHRWVEVNHFPSQTMAEVLVMFSLAVLASMIVLHFALGLGRIGPGWAMLGDGLTLFSLLGAWAVNVYSTSLSTAQRDLPPALQSYWFPFHLSALIFSYATLAIAAVLCFLFFAIHLWSSLFGGKARTLGLQLGVLAAMALLWLATARVALTTALPWWGGLGLLALVVAGSLAVARRWLGGLFAGSGTLPAWMLGAVLVIAPIMGKAGVYISVSLALVIGLVGVVFAVLWLRGRRREQPLLPSVGALAGIEFTMDQVSFRAFSVGFPFLTAGLFMGAFWAQEAWANYWGWDSKENSALITWLVYVVYVHLRMLGGYRGTKAMAVLAGGAISILITFQLFGYFPDSQKSLHRYTDDNVVPSEGMQGPSAATDTAQGSDSLADTESARRD